MIELHGLYLMNCIWNTRVEKHNLRGSENIMNMKIRNLIEMNKMIGWQLTLLRNMNGLFCDD